MSSDTNITTEQLDLLRTFADGPKIWDAARLFDIVGQLHDLGLVQFIGDGPKAQITDAGRRFIDEKQA